MEFAGTYRPHGASVRTPQRWMSCDCARKRRSIRFTVIFVPPCYVDEAVAAVAGTAIRVGIPIGFPLGGHTTKTKVAEAVEAVARGAQVLDMVMNVSRLKSGDREYVRKDIAEVVNATPGVEHKVILETCYLNQKRSVWPVSWLWRREPTT